MKFVAYILFFLCCNASILFAQTNTSHTVQASETLYSISRKYNVSVQDIIKANNIENNVIKIGQTLQIPTISTENNTETVITPQENNFDKVAVAEGSNPVYYNAKDGETLRAIAFSHQVVVDSLSVWNGILPDKPLTEGQQIIVSVTGELKNIDQKAIEVHSKSYADLTIEEAKDYNIPMQKVERGNGQVVDLPNNTSKLMALHRTETVGSYIKVINPNNDRQAIVRVVAPLPDAAIEDGIIIRVSEETAKKIGAVGSDFKVRIEYNQ
ncbi:LysM peptidoglycan-binding domain-containing protein [Flammeovirga yaeyamensis]|uniref:LysM peptidoglycan-binding domain-containing protein n=1 Tax=Flammeovirga yaeyamensis TaxID=367791 RepID=A0AAX1N4D0_9BACT|nr:LysM peptidoglycan-binding domain-containing protein [Flammeovirga yaeyamensis]MBB3698647.1 LysM repeat protein [Flammeovirga yaeyamensis]NMF34007.1 LysM peptidoglycan-binding domain-containing protein [Flammeovirga yaeyamensis]QWG00995.1 LysM peptidoglycan-binding domain-containing protein [Flammeovirga yaeyamensis]